MTQQNIYRNGLVLFGGQTLHSLLGQHLLSFQTLLEIWKQVFVVFRVGQTLSGFFGDLRLKRN